MPNDTPLMVIPFNFGEGWYSIMIVLQEGNVSRIRAHDPAVVQVADIMAHVPSTSMGHLRDVIVTYATAEDIAYVERCADEGRPSDGLKRLTRGYRYRPDLGDHDGPPELLGSDKQG
jgi:hypothetical protein